MPKPKQEVAESYYCKRPRQEGLILLFNSHHYLMAEYNGRTGEVRWQRVLAATQRVEVERWLKEQFPIRKTPPARVKTTAAGR